MREKYRRMTPRAAWKIYGLAEGVEFFISEFVVDGYTDIHWMCQKYIRDIIYEEDGIVSADEMNHVTVLFEKYVRDYVDKQGGFDKLRLLSEEEVVAIEDANIAGLLDAYHAYIQNKIPKNNLACIFIPY